MKTWVIAVFFMTGLCVASLASVDYFADGCIVDGRALKEIRPGLQVWVQGERCQQFIIHTERGRRRDTHGGIRY